MSDISSSLIDHPHPSVFIRVHLPLQKNAPSQQIERGDTSLNQGRMPYLPAPHARLPSPRQQHQATEPIGKTDDTRRGIGTVLVEGFVSVCALHTGRNGKGSLARSRFEHVKDLSFPGRVDPPVSCPFFCGGPGCAYCLKVRKTVAFQVVSSFFCRCFTQNRGVNDEHLRGESRPGYDGG